MTMLETALARVERQIALLQRERARIAIDRRLEDRVMAAPDDRYIGPLGDFWRAADELDERLAARDERLGLTPEAQRPKLTLIKGGGE